MPSPVLVDAILAASVYEITPASLGGHGIECSNVVKTR
jgi:hypothetical protein